MNDEQRNAQRVAVYAFKKSLRHLLHEHKIDNAVGIPDHILTDFIMAQIMALGKVQDTIELWNKLRR